MEMVAGAVFLLTMHAVNGTRGHISSIMFGVPGDGDDAATTVDGYSVAKKGEAGRAGRILLAGNAGLQLRGSFLGLVASLILFGFWVTIPLFLLAFLRGVVEESWRLSLALSAGGSMPLALVFHIGLGVTLHRHFLLEPVLDHFLG